MTTKRLIRFTSGALAGQFRFVAKQSGCTQGPRSVFHSIDPNFPDDTDPWAQPPLMNAVTYPREPSTSSAVDCADKQIKADAAAAKRAAALFAARITYNPPASPSILVNVFETLLEVFK